MHTHTSWSMIRLRHVTHFWSIRLFLSLEELFQKCLILIRNVQKEKIIFLNHSHHWHCIASLSYWHQSVNIAEIATVQKGAGGGKREKSEDMTEPYRTDWDSLNKDFFVSKQMSLWSMLLFVGYLITCSPKVLNDKHTKHKLFAFP